MSDRHVLVNVAAPVEAHKVHREVHGQARDAALLVVDRGAVELLRVLFDRLREALENARSHLVGGVGNVALEHEEGLVGARRRLLRRLGARALDRHVPGEVLGHKAVAATRRREAVAERVQDAHIHLLGVLLRVAAAALGHLGKLRRDLAQHREKEQRRKGGRRLVQLAEQVAQRGGQARLAVARARAARVRVERGLQLGNAAQHLQRRVQVARITEVRETDLEIRLRQPHHVPPWPGPRPSCPRGTAPAGPAPAAARPPCRAP